MSMRLQSRPIDRQRAARMVLAFALEDPAALDQVLRECDDAADDHGVTGVLLALVATLHDVSLVNAGSEQALLDELQRGLIALTQPDGDDAA